MHKGIFKTFVCVLVLVFISHNAMAWGMLGHRIVGEIAERHLKSEAKRKVKSILGNESIAMASNWADFIKSDTSYRYLNTWHYVNFDDKLTYEQMQAFLQNDNEIDAYTRINFLVAELKKKDLAQDKKIFYLRLLIHLVGDIHQPMHATKKGITGGNDIRVQWFSQNSNLHRVWDEHLIEYQQLSYTEYANVLDFTTKAQRKELQSQPLSRWLYDSYSKSLLIVDEIKGENPRLGYDYNFKHVATLNEQLLKGGIHLAGMLNEIFD
jgi:hypothetical protein